MKAFFALLLVSLMFLAGCQKDELTPVSPTDKILSKVQVPFNATLDGMVVITVPPTSECGSMPRSNVSGSGVATHIGSFTTEAYACIIPDAQVPSNGTCINGHQTVIAANGDMLYATFYGEYETNLTTGIVAYDLHYTFTGGTGRFTGVEGELELTASAVYGGPGQSKPFHAEGVGYIEYQNVKPFNGKLVGESDVHAAYTCGPGLTGRIVELEGQMNIGFCEATLEHCSGVTSPEGGVLKNGTATLFTPDGNLFVDYEGLFIFDHPIPNQTCAIIHTLTGVITGGTGKYLNASGSVDGEGIQYLTTTPTPVELKVKGYLLK